MTFFGEGRKGATFDDGIEYALRLLLASPQFLVRGEREPAAAARRAGLSDHRSRARVAAVVLPLEQHSRTTS